MNEIRMFDNVVFPILFCSVDCVEIFLKRQESYQSLVYSLLKQFHSRQSKMDKVEADAVKEKKNAPQVSLTSKVENKTDKDSTLTKYVCDDEDLSYNKWKLELAWLTKALEPALQLCRWALPTGLFKSSYDLSNDIACTLQLCMAYNLMQ